MRIVVVLESALPRLAPDFVALIVFGDLLRSRRCPVLMSERESGRRMQDEDVELVHLIDQTLLRRVEFNTLRLGPTDFVLDALHVAPVPNT